MEIISLRVSKFTGMICVSGWKSAKPSARKPGMVGRREALKFTSSSEMESSMSALPATIGGHYSLIGILYGI